MDILGTAVLADPETGEIYMPTDAQLADSQNFGTGTIGILVLIDPETGEPYALEH